MSQWYTTQTERKATLTDFSLASRCYYDSQYEAGQYYIRSIGESASSLCYVTIYGSIPRNYDSTSTSSGLRPAFALREAAS